MSEETNIPNPNWVKSDYWAKWWTPETGEVVVQSKEEEKQFWLNYRGLKQGNVMGYLMPVEERKHSSVLVKYVK